VEFVPNLRGADHAVRLLPELHFAERAVVPTITDDAVHGRRLAGQVIGLRGAGDGGERGFDLRDGALGGARGQAWHHAGLQVTRGETDDVQDRAAHVCWSRARNSSVARRTMAVAISWTWSDFPIAVGKTSVS
jgi:hypothetical protein